MTGSSSQIAYESLPIDDPKLRRPSIELAQKHLSWIPRTSLNEGLEKTISFFAESFGTISV
jgi:nucleoside-diphosphate-sugar epimerase